LTAQSGEVIHLRADAMQVPAEIVLPETKPETEWIRGRSLQKVSPTYRHARLQTLMASVLSRWAECRGRVGTEWRFRVNPAGEAIRPLVPDVAFLSYERISMEDDTAAQVPLGAPDVAVEILSPDDRAADVQDKIDTYLRAQCSLIVIVDPEAQRVVAVDPRKRRTFSPGERFMHAVLDGLVIDVSRLFDDARR